jgi:protein-L-isoaspartate(D-aspartate) O-methyltransferase
VAGEAWAHLIARLRADGIRDERVLAAMARVPREAFVADEHGAQAYENEPLPIGEGQTISQPFVVALMLEALRLVGSEHVLEVGAGSGYQTALLAELAGSVVSLERSAALAHRARHILRELGYQAVCVQQADGTLGWPPAAPYQAIVVSAAAPYVPDALLQQLDDGGRLVLPVGGSASQDLVLLERQGAGLRRTRLGPVRFVPLIGRAGWGGPTGNGAVLH